MRNPKALLWISVLCIALTLFWIILTRLDEASAQYGPSFKNFSYQWIDNVTENVYSINFGDKNTMFVTGGDEGIFYMSTIPVVINELRSERNGVYLWISNILGWDNIKIWKSDNITVIWWEWLFGNNKVVEDYNDNATFFWWSENSILGGMSSDTPTVLLWWMKNKVEPEHDANTIVWWSSNTIYQGAKNVNILWWTRILIDWDDVVAGWQLINGDVSDSFVFNDGDSAVDLAGSGMFFLWVTNGVWFGTWTKERHQWAISNGAVKLWSIDIQGVECTSENVWVMWLWNGCMVWCTSGSAIRSKWEMLGYWSLCEQICKNSDKCIAQALDTLPNEYVSFCITWSVDIANTTMCTGSRLDLYHNVVFEAHLIDSDEECSDELINQCVFRCKDQTHLTWDQTWKMGWDTKCFNDCPLPWSGSQYREHNAMITGYSLTGVNCSDGARHRDTCADYKKQLMCVDGRWYEMENGVVTETENTDYIYETCTLNEYVCDTSVDAFNLTREDIVNWKEDFIPSIWAYSVVAWNSNSYLMDFLWGNIVPGHLFEYSAISWTADSMPQLELSTQVGIRGKYELCIDYAPEMPWNQAPQNEQVCQEAGNLPGQYHYKFIGCNTWNGYDMAEDWVCRKWCYYWAQSIKHGSGIVLYTGETAICPEMCSAKNFICYDGILYADLSLGTNWKFVSWTALDSNIYNYTWCTLTGAVCDSWHYNIDEATYQSMKDIWIFSSCQSSWVFNNQCATGNSYHLDACNEGYYMSGDTCLPVVGSGCPAQELQCGIYNDLNFEDLDMYFVTDEWTTWHYTLMDRNLWATEVYDGTDNICTYWYYYQWWNNHGFPYLCHERISVEKVDTSSYSWRNPYLSGVYVCGLDSSSNNWSIETNADLWWNDTNTNVARQWPCPNNYHIPTRNEIIELVDNYWKRSADYAQNNQGVQWALDSLMPFAGSLSNNCDTFTQGNHHYSSVIWRYWSSTVVHRSLDAFRDRRFSESDIYGWNQINWNAMSAASVRCFKNSQNSILTIHPNGWTWALIILHGNEITKLWAPTKWNMNFGWWYSDSEFISTAQVKTWDIISSNIDLYAKWWCDEGYVEENGMCVLAQEAQCGSGNGWVYTQIPSELLCNFGNSSDIITWDSAFKWTCTNLISTVNCSATRTYNCGWETPDWNNMSRWNFEAYSQTSWTYKAEWELWACEWRCHEWYFQSGNTCVESYYQCEWNDPMFDNTYAEVVALINPATAEGQQKMIYRNLEEAQSHNCSYVCTGDYEFLPNPNRCVRCLEGSEERENGILVACSEIIDVCPEDYAYVAEDHQCVAYWNCYQHRMALNMPDTLRNDSPINSTITDFNVARPIWENHYWTCINNSVDVQEHKCQYSCEWNYICPGNVSTSKPQCLERSCSSRYNDNRIYAEKSEKPVAYNQSWQYLSAIDTGDFYDQVESMNWCYFWCPLDRLCKINGKNDMNQYWKCYETAELKEANCVEDPVPSYSCMGMYNDTLIWYSQSQRYSIWQSRTYETHAEIWGYEAHASEWCQEWCTNQTTDVINDPELWTICWAECSDNQYFSMTSWGGCRYCSQWQRPNPDQSTWIHYNPVDCVDKCEDGWQWWENYWVGWWEWCILGVVSANDCPEWTDYTVLENNQIKCVHNL